MQRLYFTIIPLFFLFISCGKQRPKGVLSEKEMTELMTEVALIDAYLNTLPIDSGRRVMPVLYERTFKKFKLDSTSFSQNLDYYLGNPILTEKVYTNIGKTLSEQDKVYQREDSIRNANVQDSLQAVMRLQRYTAMMRSMIMDVHRDSSAYSYILYSRDFLSKADLHLNAYAIQVPVVPQYLPTPVEQQQVETVVKDRLSDSVVPMPRRDSAGIKKVTRKPIKE